MAEMVKQESGGSVATAEHTRDNPMFTPRFDIFEKDDELVLWGDLPGVTSDDLDIDFEKNELTVRGRVAHRRHAMPDGGQLNLRVTCHGKSVRIEIEDTGCGISPEDESRIFQTYFTTKSDGTGLGLAIVQRTIEDFGGQIEFKSMPNVGTTFTITLPSVEQRQAAIRRILRELSLRKTAG